MTSLSRLISGSEDRLLQKITSYAGEFGYTEAIPLPEDVCRCSIAGINELLLKTLQSQKSAEELSPDIDFNRDAVAAFGVQVARRHRPRGIRFDTFFSLMKYYRQSYIDLVQEGSPYDDSKRSRLIVERFFDRLEIGLVAEWTGEVVGYLGTIEDLSKQQNDQEEIRRLNAELEQRVIERTTQLNTLNAENDKKLQEISSLYRMSNTMLSTMRLNKLVHLILTALTSEHNPFFDRAMLFLINGRTATMQGMLGVTRETAAGLINPVADVEDILASRWDISEEDMLKQQESEFSCEVRASRLPLDKSMNMASRAVLEKRLISIDDAAKEKLIDRQFTKRFGIKSCAFAPLMAKEQVVGVIIVDNALHGKQITKDDLRFLQLVTNQAGMAIENSMLYNRLEDANRSLREARERLVQGERLSTIGEMAASIAHEVKGPLVSIGGFARRLERKLPAQTTEHGHAATIVREVERLEKLLTDILTFAQKDHHLLFQLQCDRHYRREPGGPCSDFRGKQNTVLRKYPVERHPRCWADGLQLKQVFLNLFVNAHEAMRGGGELRITVSPDKAERADRVSRSKLPTPAAAFRSMHCTISSIRFSPRRRPVQGWDFPLRTGSSSIMAGKSISPTRRGVARNLTSFSR